MEDTTKGAMPVDQSGASPESSTPEPLGDGGKAALDAERKARAAAEKQARELAKRVQAFEDANKSELEKITARAEKAERDLAESQAARIRIEAQTSKRPIHVTLPEVE